MEIKFRARHIDTGDWWYGSSSCKDATTPNTLVPLSVFWMLVEDKILDPKTVGQYIGLNYTNGVEIYEGDRVTHPLCIKEPHEVDEPCETFAGRITFEVDAGQYFAVNTKRNGYAIVMREAYKFEVIGNIWESPELLEVKDDSS